MPAMTCTIESWDAPTATARVSITLDAWQLGTHAVPEAVLMMLTGTIEEPAKQVGKTFERELSA